MITEERHTWEKPYIPGRSAGYLKTYVMMTVSRIWCVCVFAAVFSFHRRRKHITPLPGCPGIRLPVLNFLAHASLCDGKARGKADRFGTGLSDFFVRMVLCSQHRGLFIPAKMLPGARSKLPHRCNILPLRESVVFRQEKGTGKQGNPSQIQGRKNMCVFSHNRKPWMSQERSASVADFPLDYLPLASPETTALPLMSDEVLGSRMAGSRAASGSPVVCSRAALAWPLACSHCRSSCHQEYHWCPRL
jgi:hypothetical protein